jgi:hypothetical protein
VLTAQGKPVAEAVWAIGVIEPTYYRWRSEYGGLKLDQMKRLKQLAEEWAASEGSSGLGAGEGHSEGSRLGKLLSAARRRACVERC